MLGACADTAAAGPPSYVVRPEDTLYSIAWRHDLDYRDLARWNNIGADFRISVGQVLVLGPREAPPSEHGTPARAPPRAPNASAPTHHAPIAVAPSPPPASPRAVPSAANRASRWLWPTDRVGAPRPVPGGGILLSGRLGQDVRAASAGRVVYAGSGLRGYGNLVIIKHADSLLSAYAHNREMLVRDGQEVAAGQVIAHMGEGAHQAPVLYFEIRQNGKPIDPLPFFYKLK
ncbi:MAG TPA: peptidoglycan DD-metalloendopeptidase family protein [Steroidobacteraceae bacterium]